jgi:tetratricopeptide (TPR) repeat protein
MCPPPAKGARLRWPRGLCYHALMKLTRIALGFLGLIFLSSFSFSCRRDFESFTGGSGLRQVDMDELFSLIEKYKSPDLSKQRFIINKQIIELYNTSKSDQRKILYLTYTVERFPTDPFNGYYLAVVAQTWQKLGAPLFARHYYEKVVVAYEDLFSAGEYVHKFCLQALADLSEKPQEKIVWLRELLNRFSASIDTGAAYFALARACEAAGDYAAAVEAYRQFLAAPPTTIPGFPNAVSRVKETLTLYEHPPAWVHQDLNELVALIRQAIARKDPDALQACRAEGYFFTLTWEQIKDDSLNIFTQASMTDYIGPFLLHSDVAVDAKLDIDSNAREAYLRTDNWAFRIHPTWYFYFRKVDFPADPEINGGWEWAGIYFGEKL